MNAIVHFLAHRADTDDGWVYTAEVVRAEDVAELVRLWALPVRVLDLDISEEGD